MTGIEFGRTPEEVRQKAAERSQGKASVVDLRNRGIIIGTADEIIQQLGALDRAGVQMVMLQWLDLDDLSGLAAFAKTVLPGFKAG